MGVTNYSCGLKGNIGQPETLPIRSAAATMLTASPIPVNKETGQAGRRAGQHLVWPRCPPAQCPRNELTV
jgi:hypothetical protein